MEHWTGFPAGLRGPRGPTSEPGRLHPAKTGFDDPDALVAQRDIGDRQRVVVGGEDELAVEMLGALDLVPVEIGPAVVVPAQIGPEALGAEQP